MRKLLFLLGITLSISASAQLQNLDFEQWDTVDVGYRPKSWIWTNSVLFGPEYLFIYPPDEDAQLNNYALKLSLWYNYTKDAAYQRAAINYKPIALSGFYKYEHNIIMGNDGMEVDTAMITVYLTKHNMTTHINDTVGKGILNIGDSTNIYTLFTVPITYSVNAIPDSIIVTLDPSLVRRYEDKQYQYTSGDGRTSFFKVDNLSLIEEGATNINNIKQGVKFDIYPNPTTGEIHFKRISGRLVIYDLAGRRVKQIKLIEANSISVNDLQNGIYIISIDNDKGTYQTSFSKL